jgi:hypothetical protein
VHKRFETETALLVAKEFFTGCLRPKTNRRTGLGEKPQVLAIVGAVFQEKTVGDICERLIKRKTG